jgi:hypothetical protein
MSNGELRSVKILQAVSIFQNAKLEKTLKKSSVQISSSLNQVAQSVQKQTSLLAEIQNTQEQQLNIQNQQLNIQNKQLNIQDQQLNIQDQQLNLMLVNEKRTQLKEAEEEKTKFIRQAIFELRKELDDLSHEPQNSFDYVLRLVNLKDQIKIHQISPSIVDDFQDKQYVDEIIKEIDRLHSDLRSSDFPDRAALTKIIDKLQSVPDFSPEEIPNEFKSMSIEKLEDLNSRCKTFLDLCQSESVTKVEEGLMFTEEDFVDLKPNSVLGDKTVSDVFERIKPREDKEGVILKVGRKMWRMGIRLFVSLFFCAIGVFIVTALMGIEDGSDASDTVLYVSGSIWIIFNIWKAFKKEEKKPVVVEITNEEIDAVKNLKLKIIGFVILNTRNKIKIQKHNQTIDDLQAELNRIKDSYPASIIFRDSLKSIIKGEYVVL